MKGILLALTLPTVQSAYLDHPADGNQLQELLGEIQTNVSDTSSNLQEPVALENLTDSQRLQQLLQLIHDYYENFDAPAERQLQPGVSESSTISLTPTLTPSRTVTTTRTPSRTPTPTPTRTVAKYSETKFMTCFQQVCNNFKNADGVRINNQGPCGVLNIENDNLSFTAAVINGAIRTTAGGGLPAFDFWISAERAYPYAAAAKIIGRDVGDQTWTDHAFPLIIDDEGIPNVVTGDYTNLGAALIELGGSLTYVPRQECSNYGFLSIRPKEPTVTTVPTASVTSSPSVSGSTLSSPSDSITISSSYSSKPSPTENRTPTTYSTSRSTMSYSLPNTPTASITSTGSLARTLSALKTATATFSAVATRTATTTMTNIDILLRGVGLKMNRSKTASTRGRWC